MYFLLLGAGDTAYFNDILGDREERRELIDKYVDEYNATTDIEEQKKIAATLQENAIEEAAIIPVVSSTHLPCTILQRFLSRTAYLTPTGKQETTSLKIGNFFPAQL